MTERTVAIIPARGGSKRIPNKNIKDFCGAPMISWSIKAALASKLFAKVIVSTDSEEIRDVAISYGAEVPMLRPPELSDDYANVPEVIKHALEWLIENDEPPTNICTIFATAPLLEPSDLIAGKQLFDSCGADIVFSGAEMPFPIQRSFKLNEERRIEMFQEQHYFTRSQDLEAAYQDAGQFYFWKAQAVLDEVIVFSDRATLHVLPRRKVVDIDTPEDWEFAEVLFEVNKQFREG
jgi:pseudaminic acid cytidylyltransferase